MLFFLALIELILVIFCYNVYAKNILKKLCYFQQNWRKLLIKSVQNNKNSDLNKKLQHYECEVMMQYIEILSKKTLGIKIYVIVELINIDWNHCSGKKIILFLIKP